MKTELLLLSLVAAAAILFFVCMVIGTFFSMNPNRIPRQIEKVVVSVVDTSHIPNQYKSISSEGGIGDSIEWNTEPTYQNHYGCMYLSKCGRFAIGWEWTTKTSSASQYFMNLTTGLKYGGAENSFITIK